MGYRLTNAEDVRASESEEELLQDKATPQPEEDTQDCYKHDTYSEPEKSSCLTRWDWKNIVTIASLWVAWLLINMSYSIVAPFFPEMAENKGASPLMVGIIIGCTPLLVVLISPVFGYLLPLTGVRLPIFLGLLLVGTAYVGLAFVLLIPSTWGFVMVAIALRLVEGLGGTMFMTATFTLLPTLFPQHISTLVALLEVAAGVGFVIGPPVGGGLYKAGGYKFPFLTIGALMLIVAIPCTLLVRKINGSDKETLSIKSVFKIACNLNIITLVLAMIFSNLCFGFYETTLQPFIVETFNVANEYVSLMFCTGALSYVISGLILGPVVDKIGYNRWFVIFGIMIATIAFFAMGVITFVGRWYILVENVSDLLLGIGATFSIVPVYSDMLKIAERYATKTESQAAVAAFVSGIIASSLSFGEFSGSLIGGLLTKYFSFPMSALIIGEILLMELLLLIGVTVIDRYVFNDQMLL